MRHVPPFVYLMGICAGAMLIPAIYASVVNLDRVAQPFFYGAVLLGVATGLIALATARLQRQSSARDDLLTLLAGFALLPLILAVPMREAVPSTSLFNAYFEMVSAMTTTGASIFGAPERIPMPIHLWRALVGWMGGFMMLLSAAAILAPLNLGGYEVLRPRRDTSLGPQHRKGARMEGRLWALSKKIFPVYASATLALWLALMAMGTAPAAAICVAFSTLSTSAILPSSEMGAVIEMPWAELVVFAFLFFAISRQAFTNEFNRRFLPRLVDDREIRIALILVVSITTVLFLRHWFGAFEVDEEGDVFQAFRSFWGALFTNMSFLTTTGFVSSQWEAAANWSALPNSQLILAGLCILGGGVATTAGGVKLLRVYALYQHGVREMARLVHPSSIGRAGNMGRDLRRQGAVISWVFFMLFAISIALVAMALSLAGQDFEEALIFAISALSTTGPLAEMSLPGVANYSELARVEKTILMVAMILGRLETLAILALFNPDFWRS